jgi:hypothetical protein
MRRDLKNIAEYEKPSNDAFASVVRSFGEANRRFQALAVESVGRAAEIQSQFIGKAYDSYISQISRLGRMFFVGDNTFTGRAPHASLNKKDGADKTHDPWVASAETAPKPARRRIAPQSMTTKRKTGAATSQSKRSAKSKKKAGSERRRG